MHLYTASSPTIPVEDTTDTEGGFVSSTESPVCQFSDMHSVR